MSRGGYFICVGIWGISGPMWKDRVKDVLMENVWVVVWVCFIYSSLSENGTCLQQWDALSVFYGSCVIGHSGNSLKINYSCQGNGPVLASPITASQIHTYITKHMRAHPVCFYAHSGNAYWSPDPLYVTSMISNIWLQLTIFLMSFYLLMIFSITHFVYKMSGKCPSQFSKAQGEATKILLLSNQHTKT